MARSSSTSSSEARPWVWALLFIAAVEVAVALAVPRVAPIDAGERLGSAATEPTFSESILDHQLRRIPTMAPADVVVVGDSTALTSVIPREVDLGAARVTNLGTIAPLGVAGHADVLERYLAHHPPPAVVSYVFTDDSLSTDDARLAGMGMQRAFRAWLGRDESVVVDWPTSRLRVYARRLVGQGWDHDWANDRATRAFMEKNDGYWRETHADFDPAQATRIPIPVHPDALAGLDRLIALTRGRSALLFVRGPVPDALVQPGDEARHAANAALLQNLRALGDHVHVAQPYLRVLPASAFGTPTHPKLPAAIANSRWLAEQIQPLL